MTVGKALVVCLDTLGDLTLRQPLLSALLDGGLEVGLVVRDAYAPLVPFLDPRLTIVRTSVDPYQPGADSRARLEALKADIEAARPDLLVFSAYTRSFADEWVLRSVSVPRTAAFASEPLRSVRGWLAPLLPGADLEARAPVSLEVEVPEDAHETERNAALGATILGRPLPDRDPVITLPDAVRVAAATRLAALGLSPGGYVFGCPGGTANHALKGWPARGFADQVVHLHRRHGLPVLLSGLPAESDRLDEVAREAAAQDVPVVVHVGDADGLPLLLGLIAHSRLYLGTDTGPMHFAAALGKPVVALFGGGHWPRFLPRVRRSFVATQALPCFRCEWNCWLNEPYCITEVRPAAVREGIDWILGDGPDERRVHEGDTLDSRTDRFLRSAYARRQAREKVWADAIEQAQDDARERLVQLEDAGRRLAEVDRARHADAAELTGYIRTLEGDNAARLQIMAVRQAQVEQLEGELAAARNERERGLSRRLGRFLRRLRRA